MSWVDCFLEEKTLCFSKDKRYLQVTARRCVRARVNLEGVRAPARTGHHEGWGTRAAALIGRLCLPDQVLGTAARPGWCAFGRSVGVAGFGDSTRVAKRGCWWA